MDYRTNRLDDLKKKYSKELLIYKDKFEVRDDDYFNILRSDKETFDIIVFIRVNNFWFSRLFFDTVLLALKDPGKSIIIGIPSFDGIELNEFKNEKLEFLFSDEYLYSLWNPAVKAFNGKWINSRLFILQS